jgi:predicted DNA-binding transcriptional regulator AlpA
MPNAAAKSQEPLPYSPSPRKPPLAESYPWIQEAGNRHSSPEVVYQAGNGREVSSPTPPRFPNPEAFQERLLNAREVAARLGVSERWVRDHTTRRFPKIRAVKLGTLIRYRRVDVEVFMESLDTSRSSPQPRFGG